MSHITLAQDIHFSQFNQMPLNVSPAKTGLFDNEYIGSQYRLNAGYRQQWRSIASQNFASPKPYNTYFASIDKNLGGLNIFGRDIVGIGFSFFKDQAGDVNLAQSQANISLAFHKALNVSQTQFLSLGFNTNFNQKAFNKSGTFDNQWNGNSFDNNSSTGESFNSYQINYLDWGLGLGYWLNIPNGTKLHSSINVQHLNRPSQNFIQSKNLNKLAYLWGGNLEIVQSLNEKYFYVPSLLFLKQASAKAFTLSQQIRIRTDIAIYHQFGIGARFNSNYQYSTATDACILYYKYSYQKANVGLSYDFNISNLTPATNNLGAFEFSVQYYFGNDYNPKNKHHRSRLECPKHEPVKNKALKLF